MVTITRRFEFSAAHRYWRADWSAAENERAFGAYSSLYGHGHNYTLEVTIRGVTDPQTGMVMNLTDLKASVNEVLKEFDHKHLNEDTPYFRDLVPTTENIARVLWRLIEPRLPNHVTLAHIRLYEMSDLWADYDGSEEAQFARSYMFASAHRLHSPHLSDEENLRIYDKCNNPNGHGHNYTLEVTVRGTPDAATGMVIDLEQMDRIVRGVLSELHNHHLDNEVAAFATMPSTAENLVVYLWEQLAPPLEGRLVHLKLWETRKNIAEYTGV